MSNKNLSAIIRTGPRVHVVPFLPIKDIVSLAYCSKDGAKLLSDNAVMQTVARAQLLGAEKEYLGEKPLLMVPNMPPRLVVQLLAQKWLGELWEEACGKCKESSGDWAKRDEREEDEKAMKKVRSRLNMVFKG